MVATKMEKPRLGTCAVYARSAVVDLESIDRQKTICCDYAAAQRWQKTGEYADNGWSGLSKERPALQQLLNDAAAGTFQHLIVDHMDRLARSSPFVVSILFQLLSYGVGVHFAGECGDVRQLRVSKPYGFSPRD